MTCLSDTGHLSKVDWYLHGIGLGGWREGFPNDLTGAQRWVYWSKALPSWLTSRSTKVLLVVWLLEVYVLVPIHQQLITRFKQNLGDHSRVVYLGLWHLCLPYYKSTSLPWSAKETTKNCPNLHQCYAFSWRWYSIWNSVSFSLWAHQPNFTLVWPLNHLLKYLIEQ